MRVKRGTIFSIAAATVFFIGASAQAESGEVSAANPQGGWGDSAGLDLNIRWPTVLGHGMFWPGVVMSLAGGALIEVDPHGKIGVAGAVTAGVGVLTMAAGSVVLGLFYGSTRVYRVSASSVFVTPLSNGIALGYTRAF